MPRLSDTMGEGAISTWRKQPGDAVAVGDVLVEIETDKAVMEYEAYQAGTLAEILVPEGQERRHRRPDRPARRRCRRSRAIHSHRVRAVGPAAAAPSVSAASAQPSLNDRAPTGRAGRSATPVPEPAASSPARTDMPTAAAASSRHPWCGSWPGRTTWTCPMSPAAAQAAASSAPTSAICWPGTRRPKQRDASPPAPAVVAPALRAVRVRRQRRARARRARRCLPGAGRPAATETDEVRGTRGVP